MGALVGFALEQQMPDLRAIAECQYDLVRSSERRECGRGRLQIVTLHLGGDLFASARERVPAECSDDTHLNVPGRGLRGSEGVPRRPRSGGAVTTCVAERAASHAVAAASSARPGAVPLRTGGGTISTGR